MWLPQRPQLAERVELGSIARWAGRLSKLELLVLGAAVAYIAAFAGTGLLRAIYPYPIDGLENGAMQEVQRVLNNQPIYVAPSLDYVPLLYGPLYFYLAGALAAISGSELFGLRAVSWLASIGAIGVVVLLVRREIGSWSTGLVGGALLAASAPLLSGAMDVGRTDATLLLLLLAAVYAARVAIEPTATWRSGVCSGALMGLALLTKQSGVPVAVALVVVFAIVRRAQLPGFVGALAVIGGGGLLVLIAQSGAWPLYYMWQLPRAHQVLPELLPRLWDHLLDRFTLPLVLGPFYLVMRALVGDRMRVVFYAVVALGMLGIAWIGQATINGGRNVELPAYAVGSLLFALSLHEALSLTRRATPIARTLHGCALTVALAQFAVMLYNPRLVVPYRSDMWDGDRLSETLAALPGPIFAGGFKGFLDDAPDAVAPDLAAVLELQGEQVRPATTEGDAWSGELAKALVNRRFTYLIVDPDVNNSMVTLLADAYGYTHVGPLFPPDDKYWEWRTGWAPKVEVYARPDLAVNTR